MIEVIIMIKIISAPSYNGNDDAPSYGPSIHASGGAEGGW